ncbi:MAG: hypothetical protein JSW40_03520 [Candidatus Omnitrophota bacterium]|nr:MAG: hypothetical protein JSW40_03520 [Candidatus Omnitrophota bacterium]
MAQKVCQCGIKREPGYLYFVDKKGDVSRAKMARGGKLKRKPKKKAKKRKGKKRKAKRRRR